MDSPYIRPCSVILKPLYPNATPDLSKELKKAIYDRKILTARTRKKFIEALDEIDSKSRFERKKNQKEKVISEILLSEQSYLKQLEKVVEFFINPSIERNLLKRSEVDVLFSNIKSIYIINQQLLEELKNDATVAFSRIAPFFKLYSVYAAEYKKSITFLQNCQLSNPKFMKFLEAQESRPEVQSKLSALLIAPIQRIPRYKLLLQELLTYTDSEEKAYNSLKESLMKVIEAADHINNIIEEQENAQRLLELQRYMCSGEPKIIVPGRRLLKDGILMKVKEKGAPAQRFYVILTSDIIMYCKMKSDELKLNSLKCSDIYPLNKCKVTEILDKGCFRVTCQNEEITLYSKKLTETKEWIQEIKSAIKNYIDDRKTLRKESSARRPVKRKDLDLYSDGGLSPGKPLKKRRLADEVNGVLEAPVTSRINGRRSIRECSRLTEEPAMSSTPRIHRESVNYNGNGRCGFFLGEPQCQDLVIYEKNTFTSKVGSFFGGIGSRFKNMLGFR